MSVTSIRLYRVLLYAYPPRFRARFGDEMVSLLADRRRHDGRAAWRLLLGEVVDAARTAPRMRLESPMNRLVILVVAGTIAVFAALVGQLLLLPVAVLGVAAWFAWGRPLQPIAAAPTSRRWTPWVGVGALAIAAAVTIPAIDGGELSSFWWNVMMLTLLCGIASTIAGASLAVVARQNR